MYDEVVEICKTVRRKLDTHHTEATFKRAIASEFMARGVRFKQEAPHLVTYNGEPVAWNRTDFIVDDSVVLEIKAVSVLRDAHRQQAMRYHKTLSMPVILVNFKTALDKSSLEVQNFD
jgi:GxxExxY protein